MKRSYVNFLVSSILLFVVRTWQEGDLFFEFTHSAPERGRGSRIRHFCLLRRLSLLFRPIGRHRAWQGRLELCRKPEIATEAVSARSLAVFFWKHKLLSFDMPELCHVFQGLGT